MMRVRFPVPSNSSKNEHYVHGNRWHYLIPESYLYSMLPSKLCYKQEHVNKQRYGIIMLKVIINFIGEQKPCVYTYTLVLYHNSSPNQTADLSLDATPQQLLNSWKLIYS